MAWTDVARAASAASRAAKAHMKGRARLTHPFSGGRKARGVTKAHSPMIWENMLGTVMAQNRKGVNKYFDYKWKAARKYAGVKYAKDLRIAKVKTSYQGYPERGRIALWGIRGKRK